MIYRCSYCKEQTRPRDSVECEGNPDAISDGMCEFCDRVVKADMWATPERVRALSLAARRMAGV